MAPCVIADSDDDDDSSYSPPSKIPPPVAGHDLDTTRSYDAVDVSDSTDSAFFRSVFQEQSEAARGRANVSDRDRSDKATSRGFGASSAMMSTDPLQGHERDAEMDHEREELPGNPSRGGADDPWEIPSSPEMGHGSAIARRKPQIRRKEASEGDATHNIFSRHDKDGHRSSKRRKIEPLQNQTQDSDSVDLVKLPSPQQRDGAYGSQPSAPLPTSSRAIRIGTVGTTLTNSQKETYQSFAATGTTELSQDQGPMRPEDATPIVRSSSSATNVNTPRSDLKCSRNMDTIPEQEQHTPEKSEATMTGAQWNSSPDEISALEPTLAATPAVRRKRGRGRQQQPPAEILPPEEEMEHGNDTTRREQGPKIQEVEREASDYEEKNVMAQKPNKQRGRPKKTTLADAASATRPTSPPTSHAAEGRSVTKTKKKRGRPKKAEQQAVEDIKEDVAPDTQVNTEAQEVAKREDDTLSEREETTVDPVPAKPDLQPRGQAVDPVESPRAGPASVASGQKPYGEEEKVELPNIAKPSTSAAKTPTAGLTSSASKPIYRVGLSKRSRIAPLLKIRK